MGNHGRPLEWLVANWDGMVVALIVTFSASTITMALKGARGVTIVVSLLSSFMLTGMAVPLAADLRRHRCDIVESDVVRHPVRGTSGTTGPGLGRWHRQESVAGASRSERRGAEAMSPLDYFWTVVGNLGAAPWIFKAVCAGVMLVFVYLLPRKPEHIPLAIGLGMIVASIWLPPFGPFGDWLVYPSATILLGRWYFTLRPYIKVVQAQQGPSAEAVLIEAAKRSLTKTPS